jgi:hypothetical protein
MKKNMSLFLGVVAIVLAALIFSGCPTEATAEKVVTTTKGAAADLNGLEALLNEDGVYAVDYHGTLAIGSRSLHIPSGKTVNVQGGGVTIGSGGTLFVEGTLNLPSGSLITVASDGYVLGNVSDSYLAEGITRLDITNDIAEADFSKGAVAVQSVDSTALSNVTATTGTLLVLGELKIETAELAPTVEVKALGNVVLSSNETVSIANPNLNFTEATLKSETAVAVATGTEGKTVGAIEAAGSFTLIAGGDLTVTGAANFAGDATFDGAVKFDGDVKFGGDVATTAKFNADSTLSEGKTITVAPAAKLDVAGGNLSISGNITVADTAELDVDENAQLIVTGTVKVENGGTIAEPQGTVPNPSVNKSKSVAGGPLFSFWPSSQRIVLQGNGRIDLEKGSTYDYGSGTLIGAGNPDYVWASDSPNGSVTLRANKTTELIGVKVDVGQAAGIGAGEIIGILENAELVVPSGKTFAVDGTIGVYGTFTVNGTIGGDGKIYRPDKDITWEAVPNGEDNITTSSLITVTFDVPVLGLSYDDITVIKGSGDVTTSIPTGNGASWNLPINVAKSGTVQVSINKEYVSKGTATVIVYKQGEPVDPDITPPGDVSGINAAASDNAITLTWTDPTDTDGDLDHIEISWSGQQGGPVSVDPDLEEYVVEDLEPGTEYTFTVKAVDEAGNRSSGIQTTVKTLGSPKAGVTVTFSGLPQDETIDLTGKQDLSWLDDTELKVSVDGDFEAYRWALDGTVLSETTKNLTLTAGAGPLADVKTYTLTVFVKTDDVEYSKLVTFKVTGIEEQE